ncbi:MAG: hypothetical protein H0T97_01925 [Actinobacteria bacterium]|nr:hypothetical protein [Actinomycetota bacterium]
MPNRKVMAVPQGLTLKHDRDLVDRERRPIVRRVLVGLLAAILVLGLFSVFGQQVDVSSAETSAARLEVSAPTKVRGGIFFQARFRVQAIEELESATLVLDSDWLEDITLNTVEPSPVGEASRNGRIALELGRIPAGDEHRLYLHFQVNPTALGTRSQDVDLYDGERLLLSLDRDAIVWP